MKKGYRIENDSIEKYDDCIIVDNYNNINVIFNVPIENRRIEEFKDINTIGVWKIKNKN